MVWGHKSWTPLDGGDLSVQNIGIDNSEEPPDYGHSRSQSLASNSANEIELSEQRSPLSTAPLMKSDSIQEYYENGSVKSSLGGIRGRFSGWRTGVLVCAATATTVCLFNIILTIWAVSSHKVAGGLSFLYTGSCDEVANMSLWIHLGINVMSTLLLSASNYTMQILSSPTRKEVDKAHQKHRWLDIGIPSTRNLRGVTWTRIGMWSALGLSSIPLHLMYNTAIFSSLTANEYNYIVVNDNFLSPTWNSNGSFPNGTNVAPNGMNTVHQKVLNGSMTKYTSADCMTAYARTFASKVRNVLLVSNHSDVTGYPWDGSLISTFNSSVLGYSTWDNTEAIPYAWICGDDYDFDPYKNGGPVCTLSKAKEGIDNWTVKTFLINYCLVEEVEEQCQLRFSLAIMIIVILANMVKAGVMITTLLRFRTPTLVTIGDAIASFLENPDAMTKGNCLSTREDLRKGRWEHEVGKRWVPKRHFWFKAASIKRWLTCNILCFFFIFLGIGLLKSGMSALGITTVSQMWALGFGTVTGNAIVSSAPSSLIPTVLFANLPQAILSFLYLTYNGLFSCVLGAHEWSLFAKHARTLRVTSPQGQQRSTYYLQLPYYYALPLLILSGTLHWLMSQSLFLALVDVYDQDGILTPNDSISKAGYSCIAIFFSIIVGSVAVILGILNGFRRYSPDIPLVGSCSAAISASCHRPEEDNLAFLGPVSWGCVNAEETEGVGHCCLSSLEVTRPVEGYFYAGRGIKGD